MVYKLRLRSSRSTSHTLQGATQPSVQQQSSEQVDTETGPLRSISNTSPPTRTPERKARKSASRIVMDIIDSPLRAIVNRKKRHSGEKHGAGGNIANYSPISQAACMVDVTNGQASDAHVTGMQVDILASEKEPNFHNVLTWLEGSAPRDIVPQILSFAGPKKICALTRVNKSWNQICESEALFRTLCADLGKWVEGEDDEPDPKDPTFWKKVYSHNPIVPLEYSTIPKATAATCNYRHYLGSDYFECDKNIRILVQPGLYVLEREILVETLGDACFTVKNHCISVNAMDMDIDIDSRPSSPASASSRSTSPVHSRRRLNSGLRNILSCRSSPVEENVHELLVDVHQIREQATIVLKTKRRNCPIFHIRQGRMKLSGISLIHYCSGTDIWNGNSAVQIQPRIDDTYRPDMPVAPNQTPTILLEKCTVMSVSGRGIVAIDGSSALLRNCYIHRCAATGLYVGGAGSIARVFSTDVVNNGIGNIRSRRGIARGHSGIYLEQGSAHLYNCNVSRNALTGVSAVSPENAVLIVKDSDLVANATDQLEMPPDGSSSRSKSSSVNNRIESRGRMQVRSGLRLEESEEEDTGIVNIEDLNDGE